MSGRQVFEVLARLPARVWLQVALGVIGFAVLAVLGFAIIVAAAATIVLVILVFKARAWLSALLSGSRPASPPVRGRGRVIDAQYEIVDRSDRGGR